jgi:hypothetical protein
MTTKKDLDSLNFQIKNLIDIWNMLVEKNNERKEVRNNERNLLYNKYLYDLVFVDQINDILEMENLLKELKEIILIKQNELIDLLELLN